MSLKEEMLALADKCEKEAPSRELDRAVDIALCGMLADQTYPPHRDPKKAAADLRARAAQRDNLWRSK